MARAFIAEYTFTGFIIQEPRRRSRDLGNQEILRISASSTALEAFRMLGATYVTFLHHDIITHC